MHEQDRALASSLRTNYIDKDMDIPIWDLLHRLVTYGGTGAMIAMVSWPASACSRPADNNSKLVVVGTAGRGPRASCAARAIVGRGSFLWMAVLQSFKVRTCVA